MGRQPHVLVVPFPAQGHLRPLMKLSNMIAEKGIKVTFVNTEVIHAQIIASLPEKHNEQGLLELVSIQDGLEPEDKRTDAVKFLDSLRSVMPGQLIDLINKIKCSDDNEPISCIIADPSIGWTLEVAKRLGLKEVAIWPAGPVCLSLLLHIPKLIEAGIIDEKGTTLRNELIQLSEDIPAWSASDFSWSCPGDPTLQKVFFECCLVVKQTIESCSWLLCNTYYQLDALACDMIPNILPIGPLLSSQKNFPSTGSLQLEDSTCVSWLDQQLKSSVIYAAFGSTTIFSECQFHELALALELSGQPFLWVVRGDLMNGSPAEFPEGFITRVANRGKIVKWAPQEKVLAHISIACFVSHCGWNSTIEGVSMGVPFLCWPYFGDQFQNKRYICDLWKVGMKLDSDQDGVISRHEIKNKIHKLFSNDAIKENALKFKEMARKSINEGGSSFKNFDKFINYLRD